MYPSNLKEETFKSALTNTSYCELYSMPSSKGISVIFSFLIYREKYSLGTTDFKEGFLSVPFCSLLSSLILKDSQCSFQPLLITAQRDWESQILPFPGYLMEMAGYFT